MTIRLVTPLLGATKSMCCWPLNGTQLSGHSRKFGALEDYGVLNQAYDGAASPQMLRMLQSVQGRAETSGR